VNKKEQLKQSLESVRMDLDQFQGGAKLISRIVRESARGHGDGDAQICSLSIRKSHTMHYFFPTALEVLKQGTHINKQLTEVITAVYISPKLALRSLQACMAAIVEAYTTRYQQEIDVDLSSDYLIYTSLNHLEYALVRVLQFLHAHHLGDQVRLWITRQEGIHIRLPGQAV
jgi:hypothetical protein